jgi:TonB family protein
MRKKTLLLLVLATCLLSFVEVSAQVYIFPKEKKGKWGYTNLRGDVVIPYQFEEAKSFRNSAACVKLKGKYGLINQQGKFLVQPTYDLLVSKGDAVVYSEDELFGLLDTLGSRVAEPVYQKVEQGEKYALNVKRDGQWYLREAGVETPAELASLVFSTTEERPRFSGCEEEVEKDQLPSCTDTKMLQFIYGNIKYPVEARKNGVEGTVYISLLITKAGKVTDVKIVRDVGAGTGEEAVRVVRMMPDWIPGKVEGTPVACKFALPVKFKLR